MKTGGDARSEDDALPTAPRPSKKRKVEEVQATGRSAPEIIVLDDSSSDLRRARLAALQPRRSRQASISHKGKKKPSAPVRTPSPISTEDDEIIQVVRIEWFTDSKANGEPLPFDNYLTFQGPPY